MCASAGGDVSPLRAKALAVITAVGGHACRTQEEHGSWAAQSRAICSPLVFIAIKAVATAVALS